MLRQTPRSTLFPYTTLFRSSSSSTARGSPRSTARRSSSSTNRSLSRSIELEERRRSEEHTSELQSPDHLVCRLLLEKKKKKKERVRQHAIKRVVRSQQEAR